MTRPNSVTTNYTYNSLSNLTSVLHQLSGSTIDGASYTVNSVGNRTAKVDQLAAVTSNYTYDNTYQLTQVAQGGTTTESYTLDPVGNRTASLGVSSYTSNSSNEMTANSNASYTYDYNGNTLTKVVGSDTTSYAWDYENRLSSVTLPGSGGTVYFKYDPLGRRIYKSLSSATSVYAYDGDNLIEETNSGGTAVARYAQGPVVDEPLAMLRSSTTSYYNADGLGNITSLANGSGTLAQTYRYDSFGKQTASSGSLVNPFQYTGREFDSATGLYYYRARYYDQAVGQFVGEDPIKFDGGINFYSYANNSPVNFSDPSGLKIDWGNYVFSNPFVRTNFNLLNTLIVQSGVPDDCFTLVVTGGDRYVDPTNPKQHLSATDNSVVSESDPNSPHLDTNGSRAIDYKIKNVKGDCSCGSAVTVDLIGRLLPKTQFATTPKSFLHNYKDGHIHNQLPNYQKFGGKY